MVLKRSVHLAILILLTISVSFVWSSLKNGKIFPISVVKVEADYAHVSPEELEHVISSDLPASFLTLDTQALTEHIKALAWVESVLLEKIWPETLKIRINEKKVMARWGEKGLLSDKKEVFYPNPPFAEATGDFPVLYGPEGQVKMLVKQYNTMTQMLKVKDLTGQMLLMSESGAWFLRLNNGTLLLLGKDEPLKRLARFLKVYEIVFGKKDHVARRIDLRYPHGMAVSWAEEPVEK